MAAPKFNGDDARGWKYRCEQFWKYRCEQFFVINETPENRKVMYAAMKFEGRALHWHQLYAQTSGKSLMDMSWDDYSRSTLLHFGEEPELEGTNHETEISSLCSYFQDVVGDVNEIEVESEKEMSAHQVFDEMPDPLRDDIEAQLSDIYICETLFSEKTEQQVVSHEINECKNDSTIMVHNDVLVEMDASSIIVFRHFKDEFGGLSPVVLVKVSCDVVMEIGTFGDIVYFGDCWGQNSFKQGLLGREMVIEFFGWKPGWMTIESCGWKLDCISLDNWVDMKTKGNETEVKDIKEYVCLENGSITSMNKVVKSDDKADSNVEDVWLENGSIRAFNWKSGCILVMDNKLVVINTMKRWLLSFASISVGSCEWKHGWISFDKNMCKKSENINLQKAYYGLESDSLMMFCEVICSGECTLWLTFDVGDFRREQNKDITLKALTAGIQAALQLEKLRNDDIQGLQMRLRFCEVAIRRLENIASAFVVVGKSQEVIRRSQETIRVAIENLRLIVKIRRIKAFYEEVLDQKQGCRSLKQDVVTYLVTYQLRSELLLNGRQVQENGDIAVDMDVDIVKQEPATRNALVISSCV